MASISSEIYGLTGGRIMLGGISTGTSSWRGAATQVYNWSSQGTRDAENNANYDVSQRMGRTLAVLSCVGETYEEKRQSNAFTRVDWNDSVHSEHLARLGYGNAGQQNLQKMLDTAGWVVQSGRIAGEGAKTTKEINGKMETVPLQIKDLTQVQLQQLASTGSFIHNGQHIVSSTYGAAGMQQAMQAASNEQRRNSRMFDVSNNDQARYSMQQLGAQQKQLLADIAAQYGTTFNGSQRDIRNLEKTLRQEQKELKAKGASTKKVDAQLKDLEIAKETGLSVGAKDNGRMASQRRTYGRQIIRQTVTGESMSKGIVFYQQAGRLTAQSAGIAFRASVGLTTGMVSITAGKLGSLASGTMFGRKAKAVQDKADSINRAAQNVGRKKSRGEKRAIRRERADRRTERGNRRFERGTKKLDDQIAKLETKKTEQSGKLSDREQRQLDRANRRKERRTKRGGRRERWQQKKLGWRQFSANVRSQWNKVRNVFNKVNIVRFSDAIKRKAVLIAGGGIFGIILSFLIMGGVAALIPYFISFMSVPATDLTGALDEVNYVQYIVNETASDLAAQFESVAKNDAETHFLIEDPVPSNNGLDWYKTVSEGEIEHIWASDEMGLPEEQRKELSGVSANLLQITSLMHFRYNDDLGFEEYNTARAYEYYMFVRTHRVAEDAAGNRTYSYEDLDDHDVSALYSTRPVYDPETQTLSRGEETCENIYIHGYSNITFGSDATLACAVNRARATMEGFLTSCVKTIAEANGVSIDTSSLMNRKAEGIWVNEVPSDNGGSCNNYTAYPAGYSDDFLYTTEEGGSCPGYEHVHTRENCYRFVETGGYYEDGVSPRGYYQLTCPFEEHVHSSWTSESNPGCYDTVYICNGHCGGHICPTVDVEIDMDWKDIIQYDSFKTPYFIAETSFSSILDWGKCRTVEAWAEKWMDRASEWFSPFPDSPITAITWCGRNLTYKGAQAIDWITGSRDNPEEEDIYGFEGWWTDSGTIDEGLLADLECFYGTYETDFEDGVDAWKDFEVVFPAGSGQALTELQIEAVLDQVRQVNPGISERRLAVIEEALRGVGQYYYSLTGSAHMNAINNTSGAGECSGFVSGVLNRALGTNYNNSAAGYYGYGSAGMPYAGDVIATNRTSGNTIATGHVLFYVGYLPDGVEGYSITSQSSGLSSEQSGPGMYVIDCTPTYGGSVIRKYSNFSGLHAWGGY